MVTEGIIYDIPHDGDCPSRWLDPCECGASKRSWRLKNDFFAYLRPGGYTLYCRRCRTREQFGFEDLSRVHDMAKHHAKWWHYGHIQIPTEVFGMRV